ncbi:MAG TPA: HEAT repeat domain-containing protein, partial [Gemmataceae bacterium]|nr:HEAT repeat domain-containing protein [Gemmataceae bacterium]
MRGIPFLVFLVAGWMGATLKIPALENPDTTGADEQTLKAVGIGTTDEALIEFFQKRTLNDADREKLKLLIKELGDDSFEVRETASAKLSALGTAAESMLKTAMEKSDDVEVIRRAEDCLKQIKRGAGAAVPAAAARLLARRKPPQAAEVLLGYLPNSENGTVTEEIRKALVALAKNDGKPNAALLAALADKSAIKRLAAAEALSKAGAGEAMAAVKKLLQDPEPDVRLQVAMTLVSAKDKDTVPVLIELLGILPR